MGAANVYHKPSVLESTQCIIPCTLYPSQMIWLLLLAPSYKWIMKKWSSLSKALRRSLFSIFHDLWYLWKLLASDSMHSPLIRLCLMSHMVKHRLLIFDMNIRNWCCPSCQEVYKIVPQLMMLIDNLLVLERVLFYWKVILFPYVTHKYFMERYFETIYLYSINLVPIDNSCWNNCYCCICQMMIVPFPSSLPYLLIEILLERQSLLFSYLFVNLVFVSVWMNGFYCIL